ncbi:uncharacterized protein [Elaeis guineensis]|uniref:Uncharacterized protein LOC105045775 n=1 Tax=Elaeis guineensis var. tenera TaxID=51953 RepID=A0A6J0PIF3_ELAGV|nr:uncharacterized protein LOC105045775 [Elaeis guineensis]
MRGEMMGEGEEDDGLRTVDCLRGRLLAERVASKVAKAEVDLMAKKLAELEKQLDVEIKSRNRAEKRLEFALKKLESLKLRDVPSQLSLSESSASSSPARFLGFRRSKGSKPDDRPLDAGQCNTRGEVETAQGLSGSEDLGGDVCSGNSSADFHLQLVSQEGSWISVGTMHSDSKGGTHHQENGKSSGNLHLHELIMVDVSSEERHGAVTQTESVENSLALVPVSMWPSSRDSKMSVGNDVEKVLASLRHVKEQLQNSIRRIPADSLPMELYG